MKDFLNRMRLFRRSIILGIMLVLIIIWIIMHEQPTTDFGNDISAVAIGVAVWLFFWERDCTLLQEHMRRKGVFGMIKMTIFRPLKDEVESMKVSLVPFNDLIDAVQCKVFWSMLMNLDKVATCFEVEWRTKMYSPVFVDLLDNDDIFNSFSLLLQEMSVYRSFLYKTAVNAQQILFCIEKGIEVPPDDALLMRARNMRGHFLDAIDKMLRYIRDADIEVGRVLRRLGVKESEIER